MDPIITPEEIKALMEDIRVSDVNPGKSPLTGKEGSKNDKLDQLASFENCIIISDQYELIIWVSEEFLILTRRERRIPREHFRESGRSYAYENDIIQTIWKAVLEGKVFTANFPDPENNNLPCQYEIIIIPINDPKLSKTTVSSPVSLIDKVQKWWLMARQPHESIWSHL